MRVSIEQDICTSCGLCEQIAPKTFYNASNGIAYVTDKSHPVDMKKPTRNTMRETVEIPDDAVEATIEAAEECPVPCIYLFGDEEVDGEGNLLAINLTT